MFNTFQFNTTPFNGDAIEIPPPQPKQAPKYIEVKTVTGQPVAFLSPEADGIDDCWIDDGFDACILTFRLPYTSPKWQYLTDSNRIWAEGKEFVILHPDAIETIRDGEKRWGKVKAYESWTLLGKDYIDAGISNDPQNPTPAWAQISILSGGSDLSGGRYLVGSAGHALYALLQGSGWKVGTVDVSGTHDMETEKESILYNIKQIQEIWGGYLAWDSANKTVSLRDEALWWDYYGFQIRYAKNLKNITRTHDLNIITRLYPFGADDLNISSVNGGLLYVENFQHTSVIYKDKYINQEITDPQKLKDRATRELAILSRPRYNYKVSIVDVRTLKGYEHESFKKGDIVDLFDLDININAQVRLIRYKHKVFEPWVCDLEIGDPIEKIGTSIAQTIKAADYVKSSIKPNTGFQNLLKAIINTAATEINGASGDYTCIDGVSTWAERVNGVLTGKLTRATPAGLIISQDGGQNWQTAISGAGIHADAAWVGKIAAGVLQIGADSAYEDGYDPSDKFDVPGYVTATADGIKVFDDADALRVLVGSWLVGAVRKYGIKIINGEIYSSIIRTGSETSTDYVELIPGSNPLNLKKGGKDSVKLYADGHTGRVAIHDSTDDKMCGYLAGMHSPGEIYGPGITLVGFDGQALRNVYVLGSSVIIEGNDCIDLKAASGGIWCYGDLHVQGSITKTGSLNYIEFTKNYGARLLNAVESPELLYYDKGTINLVNGEATVHFDPIFLECIEPDTESTPWDVWAQSYGENDVRVVEVGPDYFKIKERNNGTSNSKVKWKFEATRKSYAGIRLQEYQQD